MKYYWCVLPLAICVPLAWGADAGRALYHVETVAGSSRIGDGGPALAAQFSNIQGIAIDRLGNLYLSDTDNHRVRKVSGGVIATIAGTGVAGFSGDGGSALQRPAQFPLRPGSRFRRQRLRGRPRQPARAPHHSRRCHHHGCRHRPQGLVARRSRTHRYLPALAAQRRRGRRGQPVYRRVRRPPRAQTDSRREALDDRRHRSRRVERRRQPRVRRPDQLPGGHGVRPRRRRSISPIRATT